MADCALVAGFLLRQGVLALAGLIFWGVTFSRMRRGLDTRDFTTFAADCSKQAAQQMCGGAMMAVLGVVLAHNVGLDPLSWYASEYPFEIVATTVATKLFLLLTERVAVQRSTEDSPSLFWYRVKRIGQYNHTPGVFCWATYWVQLFHAIFLVGIPARLCAISSILVLLQLPANPVRGLANFWYELSWSCESKSIVILYAIPVLGDAVQFLIVDAVQRARSKPSVAADTSTYVPSHPAVAAGGDIGILVARR
jgi:hypothetical protein